MGFNWPPRCPKRSTPGEALVYPRQYGQTGQSGQCGQCDNSGSTLTVEMILDADSERLMQMLDSEEVGDGCERIGNSRGTERDVLFEADTLEHPKKLLMVLGTSGTGRWCFPASGPLCSARGGRHHPQQTPFIGWPSLGLSTPPSAAQRKSAWGLDDLRGPGFGVTIFRNLGSDFVCDFGLVCITAYELSRPLFYTYAKENSALQRVPTSIDPADQADRDSSAGGMTGAQTERGEAPSGNPPSRSLGAMLSVPRGRRTAKWR